MSMSRPSEERRLAVVFQDQCPQKTEVMAGEVDVLDGFPFFGRRLDNRSVGPAI